MTAFTLDKRNRIFELESIRGLDVLYILLHQTLQDQVAVVNPYLGFLLRFFRHDLIHLTSYGCGVVATRPRPAFQ